MGDNRNGVTKEDLAYIRKCLNAGESASQIAAKMKGRTRNGILGIIDRHIKGNKRWGDGNARKTVRVLPARDPRMGCHIFAEPAAPRRFSWEEGVSA